jgi:hypothetical protein
VEDPQKRVPNKFTHSQWKRLFGLIRVDPRKSVANVFEAPQKQMRPGQPPGRTVSWISRLAFPPLGAAGRRYWPDSTHTCAERHFYQHWPQKMIRRTIALQPLRRPAAQLAQRASCRGGRKCPGNRYALTRASNFPPAIHPRELPVCHRLRQHSSFSKPRELPRIR